MFLRGVYAEDEEEKSGYGGFGGTIGGGRRNFADIFDNGNKLCANKGFMTDHFNSSNFFCEKIETIRWQ